MVDGITPKLDSRKPAGKTIRIPLAYQVRKTGDGSQAPRSYNAPSFGKNSYGRTRQAPSKQPGTTSRLGANAPQSIGELTDPGEDATMEGHEAMPSSSESSSPKEAQANQMPQAPMSSGGTKVPQSPLPQRIPTSQEVSGNNDSAGTSAAEGDSSGTSEGNNEGENGNEGSGAGNTGRSAPAEELARANNFQRTKDADEEKKSGGVSDVAGLDEMAENPVELMQAAQSGNSKKIRDKALEYLKKAVIREFIMPILIGAIPNLIIGLFVLAGIIVIVIVVAAIVGDVPGVDVIRSITDILSPPK